MVVSLIFQMMYFAEENYANFYILNDNFTIQNSHISIFFLELLTHCHFRSFTWGDNSKCSKTHQKQQQKKNCLNASPYMVERRKSKKFHTLFITLCVLIFGHLAHWRLITLFTHQRTNFPTRVLLSYAATKPYSFPCLIIFFISSLDTESHGKTHNPIIIVKSCY